RADRLSRGTLEQIYFSVRMAAAELLLEEPMPVLLDDTFAFYDEKRLESVLKWLSSQKRQVIIFTCHKREQEILDKVSRNSVSIWKQERGRPGRSGERPVGKGRKSDMKIVLPGKVMMIINNLQING